MLLVIVGLQGCNIKWICRDTNTLEEHTASTLKMEAVCSCETLVSTYMSIQNYNPEDQRHLHHCENLISHDMFLVLVFTCHKFLQILKAGTAVSDLSRKNSCILLIITNCYVYYTLRYTPSSSHNEGADHIW
jgi:hypothetical protein